MLNAGGLIYFHIHFEKVFILGSPSETENVLERDRESFLIIASESLIHLKGPQKITYICIYWRIVDFLKLTEILAGQTHDPVVQLVLLMVERMRLFGHGTIGKH